jgi:hypothetical protein
MAFRRASEALSRFTVLDLTSARFGRFVESEAAPIRAPAGSFYPTGLHTFHSGANVTDRPRRALNHVYSIPLLHQQIDLPSAFGETFATDSELLKLLG